MKLYTTLNLLRKSNACARGYRALLETVGLHYDKDSAIDLLTVLRSNGLRDALWSIGVNDDKMSSARVCADFARFCAMDSSSKSSERSASFAEEYARSIGSASGHYASALAKFSASSAYDAAYYSAEIYEHPSDAYTSARARQVEKLKELLS